MEVSLLPFTQGHVFILARPQGFELVTPPLDGMILPGVTRDSVLTLAHEHSSNSNRLSGLPDDLTVSERPVTMLEVKEASESGKLVELFGAGMSSLHLLPFFSTNDFFFCDRHCCCYKPGRQDWLPWP